MSLKWQGGKKLGDEQFQAPIEMSVKCFDVWLHPFSFVANIYVGDHLKFSPLATPPSSVKITFQEPVSIPFGFLTWWHLCCKTTLSKPLKQSPSPKARSTHSMDHSLLVSQSPVHHLPWLHLLTHSSPATHILNLHHVQVLLPRALCVERWKWLR